MTDTEASDIRGTGSEPGGTVLALRALGIGDLLTAVPALRALRKAFPHKRIVLAAPERLRPLADLVEAVDLLHPTSGVGDLDWHGESPELAVNLHGEGPGSVHDLLETEPEEIITHRHPELPGVGGPPWRPELHEIDRWCRLLEQGGLPADPTDLLLAPPPRPTPHAGTVVIHPGAKDAVRRWPADRFARVANALQKDGHEIAITGDHSEIALARSVAAAAGIAPWRVLAGRTNLEELAAIIASARLVLCGDTGVAHLATAFGTPSVVLFGPMPPTLWGPPPWRRRHRALWAGRRGDPHGDRPDPGLLELEWKDVLERSRETLAVAERRLR
ncbi:glycosyltransferase family 9 protein [Glycomyces albidus]|jgi:ADP-heptose:LPS heptosyltransferase|uniref:Glycosyltransferase family 9 protein n=1 Tax=Glycomyces albidus TaxID=2656774 RepID=A0A6L5GF89_9ACTN|nr:glycosyltransferase family 9 protein [Glycomyces albidus]MQM28245.1 glycosyltransferase family 9 protein [Glycomyces albidus]